MIDPETIRRRLDELWVQLGRKADAESHEVMRACALTFIAVIGEDRDPEDAARTLAELMREHPSRTVVVRLASGSADVLEAGVDARCWMPFGARQQICSEQVVIRCTESTLREVPAVILPLIVPDLPVVLWCSSGRACGSPVFPALAALAGRVIVDSLLHSPPLQGKRVGDLSWTRLTRWRALIAQVFQNPLYRPAIPRFSDIHLHWEGADDRPAPSAALLMAGWLVSRLGWPLERVKEQLRIHRREASIRPGRLAKVELLSRAEPVTSVVISRSGAGCAEVRVEMAGIEPLMNRVSLPPSNDVLLLGEELSIDAPDPVLEESLDWARRIASMLQRQ